MTAGNDSTRVRAMLAEIPPLWEDCGQGAAGRGEIAGASSGTESVVLVNAGLLDLQRGADLWAWCMLIVDEQADMEILDEEHAPPSWAAVPHMCQWLAGQADWILDQHEFFPEDLSRIYWKYRHSAGRPPKVAHVCDRCGWKIQPQDGAAWFACTGCGRTWTLQIELAKLAEEHDSVMTLGQIARNTGISHPTLRRWAQQGLFSQVGVAQGKPLYDIRHVRQAAERVRETA